MKMLFHVHTDASACSNLSKAELTAFLDKQKINIVAVTDHNKITKINWKNGLEIYGEEIDTGEGDVIGLFLSKEIAPKMGIKNTSDEIKRQGGVVIAAHPGDVYRREAMTKGILLKNIDCFDVIETFNARNLFSVTNSNAKRIAEKNSKLTISGADAHTVNELKNVVIEIDDFIDADTFLINLKTAKFTRKKAGIWPHLKTIKKKYFTLREKR